MLEQHGYTIERGAPYARGASSDARAPRGGAGKSPVKPAIFSAAELRRREFDPIRYVVPGYIAEGCTLLAGRPKLGKSWLVLEAGLAVARGGDCLGGIACEQGDVLYLALEDNARRLQRRMDKVLGAFTEDWPAAFEFATEWPRANEGGIDAIREWIMSKENPRLVVVDVLAMFKPVRGDKESLYEADYLSIKGLQALAGEFGVAIVIVHHTRKSGSESDPFEKVSGTLGLSGAADSVVILDRDGNGATLYGRGRDIEEIESAVVFDKVACRWLVQGDASEVRRTDERGSILAALDEAEEPLSPGEISDATRMSNQNVRQLLVSMVKAGEVIKAGRGRYLHPDHNRTPDHNDHKITNPPAISSDKGAEPYLARVCDVSACDPDPITESQAAICDTSACDLVIDVIDGADVIGAPDTGLSAPATEFLNWLRSRAEQPVNARLITSHAPKHIRAQEVRDPILQELEQRGLIRIEATRASNASRVTRLIHIIEGASR